MESLMIWKRATTSLLQRNQEPIHLSPRVPCQKRVSQKTYKISTYPFSFKTLILFKQFSPVEDTVSDNHDYEPEPSFDETEDCAIKPNVSITEAPAPVIEALATSVIKAAKGSRKAKSNYLPKFEREEAKEAPPVVALVSTQNSCQDWNTIRQSMENQGDTVTSSQSDINVIPNDDILEENGTLRMFWIDAFEKSGKVYVFGKVRQDLFAYSIR